MRRKTKIMNQTHRPKPSSVDDCSPPPGRTYLTIGQDLFSIEEYVREQYNYSLHQASATSKSKSKRKKNVREVIPKLESVFPAAVMVYTDIQKLRGLDRPIDYGSGIEYADALSRFQGLQVGLWLDGSQGCTDIVEGRLDENIGMLFDYLVHSKFDKVFLRVGYEFDNPGFNYTDNPVVYQRAFRKLAGVCGRTKFCRRKVAFVWHSWAAGLPNNHTTLEDFYPGADVVDWIGISLFSQFYSSSKQFGSPGTVHEVLSFAKSQNKPIMIAESTPFGGIDKLTDPWMDWFHPVLDLIETNDISMFSFINCDWSTQPMWKWDGFGDTRISINRTIMKLWQEKVLQNPRFLKDGHLCGPLTKSSSFPLLANIGMFAQRIPPAYWIGGAALIALAAVCFRFWCLPTRSGSGAYIALQDDDEEDDFRVEPNRSGYGSLE